MKRFFLGALFFLIVLGGGFVYYLYMQGAFEKRSETAQKPFEMKCEAGKCGGGKCSGGA